MPERLSFDRRLFILSALLCFENGKVKTENGKLRACRSSLNVKLSTFTLNKVSEYVTIIQVVIVSGFHLFPFRTEKLSLVTPMVLRLWESR